MPPSLTPAQRREQERKRKAAKAAGTQDLPTYSTDPYTRTQQNPNPPPRPKPKPKKVKVKKPPIPVPSLTIQYENAPPPPKPGRGRRPKPRPSGGHLPMEYEELTPDQFLARVLGAETEAEKRQSRQQNQWRERRRRGEARAEREARQRRRERVKKLDPKARKFIGKERLNDFIQNGPKPEGPGLLDIISAIGGGVWGGVEGAVEDFTGRLSSGLQGRESGREISASDEPLLRHAGDLLIGPNVMRAARGEDFDPYWLAGELMLAAVPIKGLPTPVTAVLRAAVGTQRLLAAEKAGLTVAELIRPIGEVKVARRLRLTQEAARAGRGVQIPSSRIAGTLAGDRQGRLARIIRNDVNAVRTFRVGDAEVETAADMSRIGKGVRRVMDEIRDYRLVPLRNTETLFARQVGRKAVAAADRYAGLMHTLEASLPKGWMNNVDWPGVYAVRAVAKGTPIEDMITRTEADMLAAKEAGDWLGEQANRVHLANFKAAAKYVETNAEGHPVFKASAPAELANLRDALGRVSGEREKILIDRLGLLARTRAEGRILNEQLHYAQAQALPKDDYIAQQLAAHPTRQKIIDLWTKQRGAEEAQQGIMIQDANARRIYQHAVAYADAEIDRLKQAVERHPPGDPLHDRNRIDLARMEVEKASLDPGDFYDEIKEVSNVLPQDVIDDLSSDYGRFGRDWKFSLREGFSAPKASKGIAKSILDEKLPLPPEIAVRADLVKGIEDVFKLAEEGVPGKDWYRTAARGVVSVADHIEPGGHLPNGVTPKQVAQLFAIYSQAADTVANSTFVFDAIRQFQRHGDLFAGRFPVRQSPEALAVLQGGTWEGRKRSSFYANILRHIPGMEDEYAQTLKEMEALRGSVTNPVTVDRWVVRMFSDSLGDVPGSFYDTFEKIIQRMADEVGWEPEQIQAAAWVAMKDRGLKAEHAKAIAAGKKPRTTVRHIAGAEDAFQYGIRRQMEIEQAAMAQGDLFDLAKYEVSPAAKRLANTVNKKWGGFTVDRNLKPIDETGYVVTLSLTETAYPLHKIRPADIEQFKARYADLLKDKRNVIGGFSDDVNDMGDATEVSYLSISRRFKRKGDAIKYGREQGQETVYEYPKIDPITGKKPAIGDGIRTGLTREEQAARIQALRDAEAIPRALQADPLPSDLDRDYDRFLVRAAREFNLTRKKVPTENQKAQAEEWFFQHSAEYADEPIVQEWERLYNARQAPQQDPAWMVEEADSGRLPYVTSVVRDDVADAIGGSQLHASLFDEAGATSDAAEDILRGKGEILARGLPGYEEALTQLSRQEIPKDFIEGIVNSPLHIYDKTAIGRHLDSIAGGTLRGRDFPDIPGASRIFPDTLILAGLWEAETRALYFSDEAHPADWVHEFVHAAETADVFPPRVKSWMWEYVGAVEGAKLSHDQSEDVADLIGAMVLGFAPEKSTLPDEVKSALSALRKSMETSKRSFQRETEMLAKLPEDERLFLEDIFRFEAEEGQHFTNGFVPKPGTYTPEQHGLPFRFGNPLAPRRAATHWARLLAGKKITALTPTDDHLSHAFKGDLLRSGRWSKDITAGPLEGLMKAAQIERMTDVHDKMVSIGFLQPENVDDIMVPIEPGKWTEETRSQARSMIDIMEAMDRGDVIDAQQLSKVDAQAIENVKDFMFPGLTDSTDITRIVKQAMKEPIPGVVWVPRRLLEKTGLFGGAPLTAGHRNLKYGLDAVDTVNNIMKMMTLSLNPAYYPMNLGGQLVMLGSQMTWSAPFSLARSLGQWKRMSAEDLALADAFAGIGFAGSFQAKGGLLKGATDTVGKVGTIIIDKYPRRAAFFHEARRLGFRTDDEMHDLLNNPDLFDALMKVHERTRRAMVDYGNLNRFEREALTRLIFVYPWLRGSARYAAQFPFDHPIQAALFAGLIYWQQNRLVEAMPEGHPGYLKWYLPVNVGEGEENPYGFRMDQLFTPLQTLDIAALMTYWGTGGKLQLPWGSNEEGIGSMLGPLAEELEKTITGWDSFTREEVSHGIPQLFLRLINPEERWASWNRLQRIIEKQTHKGIYDTDQFQNWLRLFFGSLAPINIDPEAAAKQSAKRRGNPSPEQNRDAWKQTVEEVTGEPVPDEWMQWKANEQAFDKVSREYRDEHNIVGDSTIQERLAMIIYAVAETRPDLRQWAEDTEKQALAMSDEDAQANYDSLREQLGLRQIGHVDSEVGRLQQAQRVGATP